MAWKKKKIAEKKAQEKKDSDMKKAEFKAGKHIGLSGREMFTFNPELARDTEMDDGEATVEIEREIENDEENIVIKEIDIDSIINEARESDQSGTQCIETKRTFVETLNGDANINNIATETGNTNKISNSNSDGNGNTTRGDDGDDDIIDEPIDETLFADDDLNDLEEELDSVKI